MPNGDGVLVNSGDNTIGGASAGAGNLISGNARSGVYLDGLFASGNLVAGNFLGTNAAGTASLGNAIYDVYIGPDATGNTIGGLTDDGSGNPDPGTGPGNVMGSAGTAANTVYHRHRLRQ